MKALTRKLVRDLAAMRGQALAIALVVAAGVAVFVAMLGALDSLTASRDSFYDQARFADVFVSVRRAPVGVAQRLAEIPGVSRVMTRVIAEATLDLPGIEESITGRVVSIQPGREAPLNALYLRSGRAPEPGRDGEVLVSEAFASARGLAPGDRMTALLNGRRYELVITGVALSPEYVFQIGSADSIPDDRRFGVLWMAEDPLAAALDMRGVTNDISIALSPGASEPEVIAAVDRVLQPYGCAGAFGRSLHASDRFVTDELRQLRTTAMFIPAIFLAVAAFLLNIVMARTVATERTQIATLKAFGYSSFRIAKHYLEQALVLAGVGAALGVALGAVLGRGMLGLYTGYYRFPVMPLSLTRRTIGIALLATLGAAAIGAFAAVRRAAREVPAEAMKPEPPARFTRTWIEDLGVTRLLSPAGRMILRGMARRPARALLAIVGMAFAAAILVVGMFAGDAFALAMDIQFSAVQSEDATVSFVRALPASAEDDLAHMPGVLRVEPMRAVGATLRSGHRTWRTALVGVPIDGDLRRLVDRDRRVHALAPEGLVLGRTVADKLDVEAGDRVIVEPLEGDRTPRPVFVSQVVDEVLGGSVMMEIGALQRFLGEERQITGALLVLDRREESVFHERVKRTPAIASVGMRRVAYQNLERMIDDNMGTMRVFEIFFAAIIAFAIVYNNARIALAERSRELASLRVLGFSRGEVSRILLGELLVSTLVAIPLGFLLGYGMAAGVAAAYATEMMRIPLVVSSATYATAALTVAVSAALSALIVRRKVDHLDLVGVLKTRD